MYKQKYLEYKKKYLTIKEQLGGNEDEHIYDISCQNDLLETKEKEEEETMDKLYNVMNFNNYLDGQFRKDCSSEKLLKLIGNYRFKSLEDGLKLNYEFARNLKVEYD